MTFIAELFLFMKFVAAGLVWSIQHYSSIATAWQQGSIESALALALSYSGHPSHRSRHPGTPVLDIIYSLNLTKNKSIFYISYGKLL